MCSLNEFNKLDPSATTRAHQRAKFGFAGCFLSINLGSEIDNLLDVLEFGNSEISGSFRSRSFD